MDEKRKNYLELNSPDIGNKSGRLKDYFDKANNGLRTILVRLSLIFLMISNFPQDLFQVISNLKSRSAQNTQFHAPEFEEWSLQFHCQQIGAGVLCLKQPI